MKKSILLALFLFTSVLIYSQTRPINYQAVARDNSGELLTGKNIGVRATILHASASGTMIYREEHNLDTDANGILNMKIGSGLVLNGVFSAIDWSAGDFYLKIEIDLSGGTTYSVLGTTQLLSVPFAKYADKAGEATFPAGMIMAFGGDTANIPNGWLLCDGTEISRFSYSDLFAATSISWGTGDGVSTFQLPDLRGYFLRGADLSSGNDPNFADRTSGSINEKIGSYQGEATATPNTGFEISSNGGHYHSGNTSANGNHNHLISQTSTTDNGWGRVTGGSELTEPGGTWTDVAGNHSHSLTTNTTGNHNHSISTGGDLETRPKNAYVNYIIKY